MWLEEVTQLINKLTPGGTALQLNILTIFTPGCSTWVLPGMEPATQSMTNEDYALNCSNVAPSISADLMIGVTILTNA